MSDGDCRWPDFLVIGAARAGTTALHKQLAGHPQLFLPTYKESGFFAFQEPGAAAPYPGAIIGVEPYLALFREAPAASRVGEVSPAYLYYPQSAASIHRVLPRARIIAVLRHPVDRAWSAFVHQRRCRREPLADFRQALAAERQRIASGWNPFFYYTRMGFYHEQLLRYFRLFPREQLFVATYEDFQRTPGEFYRRLLEFLDVDTDWEPGRERYNVGRIARESFLRQRLRHTLMGRLYRSLLPGKLRRKLRPVQTRPNPPDARLYAELIDRFREDILRLEDLLQRDLQHWLDVDSAAPAECGHHRIG